uniref:C2H2-type domain-containing protein n=1 Tax=Moniliophthora roreri TaxID=221103 RepID=A0A0W0EZW1_MONRR
MAASHFRESAPSTPLTDNGSYKQLTSSVYLSEVQEDGYHERTSWVQGPDSRSGSSSRSGAYEPGYSSYPLPEPHDRDSYPTYRDNISQERNLAGNPYQSPSTACHSPSVMCHGHNYRYPESTANLGGGFDPLASTRESNPHRQVPSPPTVKPAKVHPSGFQLPSSYDSNGSGLFEHSPPYHRRHNHTEHHPLSVNSRGITPPLTAGYEIDRTLGHEMHGRGQDGYSSVTRNVATTAGVARQFIASPAVVAASRARRTPGKLAAYCCPHCDSTFTASHNLQSHIRSHFGTSKTQCPSILKLQCDSTGLTCHLFSSSSFVATANSTKSIKGKRETNPSSFTSSSMVNMSEFIDNNNGNGHGANAAPGNERLHFDLRTNYFYSSSGCIDFQQELPPCPIHQQAPPLCLSSVIEQQWPSQTTPVYPGTLSVEANYDDYLNLSYYDVDNGTDSLSPPNVPPKRTKPKFFCDMPGCGKSYTAAHNLKYHQRAHKRTKPFQRGQRYLAFHQAGVEDL